MPPKLHKLFIKSDNCMDGAYEDTKKKKMRKEHFSILSLRLAEGQFIGDTGREGHAQLMSHSTGLCLRVSPERNQETGSTLV